MGQPARFTEGQLRELDTAAGLIVQAIEDDVENPVASPFLDRFDSVTAEGEQLLALQDGIETVVEELDKYAIAYQQAREALAETGRELERWRHGATIEGDFVCPHELRVTELENVIEDGGERSVDVILDLRTAKARIEELEAAIASEDRGAIMGIRAALADSKRAPMATPNIRKPVAGEVIPPERRATWARKRTEHDS